MTLPAQLLGKLRAWQLCGLVLFLVGAICCVVGYRTSPRELYAAYLAAFAYWLGLGLGCLSMTLIHGLTGGAWGRSIRRIIESGYETIPLLALFFVPIWCQVAAIYPWADPDVVRHHESLIRKAGYLNIVGFQTRAIVYFVIWTAIVIVLNWCSPNDEEGFETPRHRRLQSVSGLSLIIYGFSVTLAFVDWTMSLEPEWYSTMYGPIQMAGQGVAGLSLGVVVLNMLDGLQDWQRRTEPSRLNDLGNLLLAAVMFWAYCSYFQLLVVWCGNLPEENFWYVHRSQKGWQYFAWSLLILHFAVPFLMLLSRRLKRQPGSLARIAILLLVMRFVDLYWQIIPGFQPGVSEWHGPAFHVLDLVALLTIGGAWISVFAWRLSVRLTLPMYDPDTAEIAHEQPQHAVVA